MSKTVFTATNFGFAPERTARRNAIESVITGVFERYGYSEVSLPMYEYYDVLKTITRNFSDDNIISFNDRTSGKSLVLRPDFTPQVCRMVAGYRADFPLPIRVYYRGAVFRNVNIDRGSKAEQYHIGCELFGAPELDGDAELLLCLSSCMKKVKLDNYRVVLGDGAYLSRFLKLIGDNAADYASILSNKRINELKDFLKKCRLSRELESLAADLPLLFGGRDELFRLATLSEFDPFLRNRCDYIKELFRRLSEMEMDETKVVFDLGEMRGLDYYTGVSFEVLHTETGALLGGGGRYDSLMNKFQLEYTACGMALYLSEVEPLAKVKGGGQCVDWIVVGSENRAKAEELRENGFTVMHLFDKSELASYTAVVKAKNIFED